MLADVEHVRQGRILEDGDGLVQAVLDVGEIGFDLGGGDAEEGGQLAHHRRVLLSRHARQRDVLGDLVADHDAVVAIGDDPARGGHLHVADLVGGHGLRVRRGVEHLEVPQTDEHEREQRGDDHTQYAQPDDGARRRRLAHRSCTRSTTDAPGPHAQAPLGSRGVRAGRGSLGFEAQNRMPRNGCRRRRHHGAPRECGGRGARRGVGAAQRPGRSRGAGGGFTLGIPPAAATVTARWRDGRAHATKRKSGQGQPRG